MRPHLGLPILRNSRVATINHDLHDLTVMRRYRRGIDSLPFLGAFVSSAGRSVRNSSCVAASTTEVVKEPENGQCDTKGQNSASDAEGTTVARFVIFTEDLSTVDTSDVGAHDDSASGVSWFK
jgi:hypothetical protein